MIDHIDRIAISVKDLAKATSDYALLLGIAPSWRGASEADGTEHSIFDLQNTSIDLFEAQTSSSPTEKGSLSGLVLAESDFGTIQSLYPHQLFSGKSPTRKTYVSNTTGPFSEGTIDVSEETARGLGLSLVEKDARLVDGRPKLTSQPEGGLPEVDHVVINTSDPEAALNLFGEPGLKIRLALDQTVEKWGGRMLFFRTGGISIEIVGKLAGDPNERRQDSYWGIAYRTPDIETSHKRLKAAGVQISDIRAGRKPGTRVATVKSHTLGVPTLIIGPE